MHTSQTRDVNLPTQTRTVRSALAVLTAGLVSLATVQATPEAAAAAASSKPKAAVAVPNGKAPAPAAPFNWATPSGTVKSAGGATEARAALPQNNGLFTLLIIGSDARPGQSVVKSRGDSIHLLVYNVAKQRGTLIGFPRDSYVAIPGRGNAKLTSALAWGGPELLTTTVRNLTKIAVTNYAVTGFAGFSALVDAVGGVNVLVDPPMNDRYSGARFAKGWFLMNGTTALAFTRNRHDVPNGDFGRSANHAKFLLSALAEIRGSTSDNRGLLPWVAAVKANVSTNLPLADLLVYAQIARSTDPASISSIVAPGSNGFIKSGRSRQAVVLLKPSAAGLFLDIGTDGVAGS